MTNHIPDYLRLDNLIDEVKNNVRFLNLALNDKACAEIAEWMLPHISKIDELPFGYEAGLWRFLLRFFDTYSVSPASKQFLQSHLEEFFQPPLPAALEFGVSLVDDSKEWIKVCQILRSPDGVAVMQQRLEDERKLEEDQWLEKQQDEQWKELEKQLNH
ncbi:hypothetical protein ACQ4M3_37335 [Leptolyngbya sp. AN03gr2]|uniref:hypothetical protein n=1 Tax=unclassified Leptolyngbya TaxID=2650499 RepID=UPI003D31071B